MNKLTLKILVLGCLLALSSCTEETERSADASATPRPSSTVSATATSSSGSSGGSGGSSSSGGSSGTSQSSGGSTTRPNKTPGVKSTPKTPHLTPSEWRKKNFKPRPFKDFENLEGYSVVRVSTPQPSTPTSIRSGKKLYNESCIHCHGATGTPPGRDPALVRYNMADLSRPQKYKYGSGDRALFRSIAYGVDAPVMPPCENVFSKQETWDLVNYIRTLQK